MTLERQVEDLLLVFYHRELNYGLGDTDQTGWEWKIAFNAVPGRVDISRSDEISEVFVRRGYGKFFPWDDKGDRDFRISPRGEAAAVEILERRRLKSFSERVKLWPWVGIFAFISMIAAIAAAVPVVQAWWK